MATTGVELRAQMDTENVKGLLLINGGAAVALLAALPHLIDKAAFEPLTRSILYGLLFYQVGLVAAVIHNRLRRLCSLVFEQHNFTPPACDRFVCRWLRQRFAFRWLKEPCVCQASIFFMWLALIAFVTGGLVVFEGGRRALNNRVVVIQGTKTTTVEVPPATK